MALRHGVKREVPFYPNTADNTHCVQAVFRMVLKYFLPSRSYSWKQLDNLTAKQRNKGTWLMAGLIHLKKMGFDIVDIEPFDYRRYYREGEGYLAEEFPQEVAHWYLEESNLREERKRIPSFLKAIRVSRRYATLRDAERLLEDSFLVASDINAAILHREKGFDSHLLLLTGFDKKHYFAHDPGLPPHPNRTITKSLFRRAWAQSGSLGPNLTAFRLKRGR